MTIEKRKRTKDSGKQVAKQQKLAKTAQSYGVKSNLESVPIDPAVASMVASILKKRGFSAYQR